jgi:hypothetical protein
MSIHRFPRSPEYEQIRTAILERKVVAADYQGHRRLMCPHILGMKNGQERALFYQFGGTSSSGLQPDGSDQNWRCIDIAQLRHLSVFDGRWHTAPNLSEHDSCVTVVDVRVDTVPVG